MSEFYEGGQEKTPTAETHMSNGTQSKKTGKRAPLPIEIVHRIQDMRARGHSARTIADTLGISASSVCRYTKDAPKRRVSRKGRLEPAPRNRSSGFTVNVNAATYNKLLELAKAKRVTLGVVTEEAVNAVTMLERSEAQLKTMVQTSQTTLAHMSDRIRQLTDELQNAVAENKRLREKRGLLSRIFG